MTISAFRTIGTLSLPAGIICMLMLSFPSTLFAQETVPLWLRYPAISPDGSTIAFCYKGDIYTVPAGGGRATVLTLHDGHDFMPVWAPDGKHIAFASDRYGNYDVFLIPARGGASVRLTWHSADDLPSDFSPDGRNILFTSRRTDDVKSAQFPYGRLPELYSVPAAGGRVAQVITTPAMDAQYDQSGKVILYHDQKGWEDPFRKHHTSSIARDIWALDVEKNIHKQLTDFAGEDRNPVWGPGEKNIYYLSEQGGSFNVWKFFVIAPTEKVQVTRHEKHPVRYLSIAGNGLLCYSYDGELFTVRDGEEPKKVAISIAADSRAVDRKVMPLSGNVDELAVSPNGKEVAFVMRGEVFATSVEHGMTKRLTSTPEMERSVSFSPDGRAILYASERNGSWNIYQSKLARDDEDYFYLSSMVKEEALLDGEAEEFQPAWSPDGKEIAYLEERTTLKVYNLAAGKSRTVLNGNYNYSYIDGDQYFSWAPDSRWLLVTFFDRTRWDREVGLVSASGDGKVINLSNSGYGDINPKWVLGGKAMIWYSDRYGSFRHSGRGSEDDVLAMYFTQEAWDRAGLGREELEALKEKEKKNKTDKKAAEPVRIEFNNLDRRVSRITPASGWLSDAVLSPDGDLLYYLSQSATKGYDLWSHDLVKKETKLLTNLSGRGTIHLSDDGKTIIAYSGGKLFKVETGSGKKTSITYKAEVVQDDAAERAFFFEHIWRQAYKKFYREDMHGVDWAFYKKAYARFLPHVSNTRDFSDLTSEMLGELNASHTGARYRVSGADTDDETASLGLLYDNGYSGKGVKVAEVLEGGPLDRSSSRIRTGAIIEKINGDDVLHSEQLFALLNRRAGENILLTASDPSSGRRWEESVRPLKPADENDLLYRRWVRLREAETERLSGGRLGYVHVRGMNDPSFREVYEKALGKHYGKEALVVDTRFNGGGNLHDQLCVFLSGKKYYTFYPRERVIGIEPDDRWTKPSIVIMGEGNYSDAHLFPYAYKAQGIGKLVGMPVPGTGTAVWWESLYVGLRFGIPQVGFLGNDSTYMENQELQPDVQVKNEYDKVAAGQDQQLEKAVQELLKQLGK